MKLYVLIFGLLYYSDGISNNQTLIDCKCGNNLCNDDICQSQFGYCYKKATIDDNQVIATEHGCVTYHIATNMCSQQRHRGHNVIIECCNTTNCNADSDMELFRNKIDDELKVNRKTDSGMNSDILLVVLGSLSTLVVVVFFYAIYKFVKSKMFRKLAGYEKEPFIPHDDKEPGHYTNNNNYVNEVSLSNTSGAGKTQFVERTIAKQVQMLELVGKGRYGEVWKALWRGDPVAVKTFDPRDEQSWYQEVKMYETSWLRHDNILGYIGSDCKANVSTTKWLIMMEYCEHGSLYEYLQNARYTPLQLLQSVKGIYSGLEHLHNAIHGNNPQNSKPAIAHRDLKTKNILVKNPTHCCIGDLGLAITSVNCKEQANKSNFQVGTRRYMPPEILDGTAKIDKFSTFLQADMFSSSYILWEMTHRVVIDNELSQYTLPFINEVPGAPTIEDMYKVVVEQGARPPLPDRWQKNPITRDLCKIIHELWYEDPGARLTALRIKKTLTEMFLHQQDSFPPV